MRKFFVTCLLYSCLTNQWQRFRKVSHSWLKRLGNSRIAVFSHKPWPTQIMSYIEILMSFQTFSSVNYVRSICGYFRGPNSKILSPQLLWVSLFRRSRKPHQCQNAPRSVFRYENIHITENFYKIGFRSNWFQKKFVGQNANIWICTRPINALVTALNSRD